MWHHLIRVIVTVNEIQAFYIIAVVTLQTFHLGKLDMWTVYREKLDFLSVTDFSVGNLPRGNVIVCPRLGYVSRTVVSLDSYPKARAS